MSSTYNVLSSAVNPSNHTKCVSLSNQKSMIHPTLIIMIHSTLITLIL